MRHAACVRVARADYTRRAVRTPPKNIVKPAAIDAMLGEIIRADTHTHYAAVSGTRGPAPTSPCAARSTGPELRAFVCNNS